MEKKIRIVRRPTSLDKIISDYVPATWGPVFEKSTDERQFISEMIGKKNYSPIYPLPDNIFRAFELCPLPKTQVVIVGQDPYPQERKNGVPKAVGMSFSIAPDDKDIPGSLKNIYRELLSEYPDFVVPDHGDLSGWARQGVLLLNVGLTYTPEETSDKMIGLWKPFFIKTVKALVEYNKDLIFVLWGDKAQKATLPYVNSSRALISGHPSPQAVNRGGNFIGNGHFKKINELLEKDGQEKINWQI